MSNIITLTTDFGLQDQYVSAMKAVILSIAPDIRLIDVSHQIPPQDIMAGAYVSRHNALLYPKNTVHLVVVDPGVGSSRKAIAMKVRDQILVGPDNGLFSLFFDDFEYKAYHLNNPKYWLNDVSKTFHGRDIFAPVAAHLSQGVPLDEVGSPISDLVSYRWAVPIADKDGIQGWIVHIDHYGNLITNIPKSQYEDVIGKKKAKIYVGNMILDETSLTFTDVEEGEAVVFFGSANMLEIGINKGNAQEMMGIQKGAQISVVLQR